MYVLYKHENVSLVVDDRDSYFRKTRWLPSDLLDDMEHAFDNFHGPISPMLKKIGEAILADGFGTPQDRVDGVLGRGSWVIVGNGPRCYDVVRSSEADNYSVCCGSYADRNQAVYSTRQMQE